MPQGPAKEFLFIGEAMVTEKNGVKEIKEGACVLDLCAATTYHPLVALTATEEKYLAIWSGDSVEYKPGPSKMFTSPDGMCPLTGKKVELCDKISLPTAQHFVVEYMGATPTTVCGPSLYMPPAGKKVATFMWTDPMTGKAKSKPFTTFFSGAQTMKILVKDLPDRLAGAVDVEFIVFLSLDKTVLFKDKVVPDAIGELIAYIKSDAEIWLAKGNSFLPGVSSSGGGYLWNKTGQAGSAFGFVVTDVITASVQTPDFNSMTPEAQLELAALAKKLKIETALSGMLAKQEIYLAGEYARSQNQVKAYSEYAAAEIKARARMAALAKGSGGSDTNYHKIVSIGPPMLNFVAATKTSGSTWATLSAAITAGDPSMAPAS